MTSTSMYSDLSNVITCVYLYCLLLYPIYIYSSTPLETLHTILLGPYKYLLHSLVGHVSNAKKKKIQVRIESFNFSGFDTKLSYNLCSHFRSFVGKDFKAIAQVALFLLDSYMTSSEKNVWLSLSKVL